jgi:hypothetical protein
MNITFDPIASFKSSDTQRQNATALPTMKPIDGLTKPLTPKQKAKRFIAWRKRQSYVLSF